MKKTESGFEFDVDESALDDAELLEDLVKIDRGDTYVIFDAIKKLLGEEGKERLYKHLRGTNGRVSLKAVLAEFTEIFNSLKEGKN